MEEVKVFINMLNDVDCNYLLPFAREAFTAKAIDDEEDENYSSGSTFFIKGNEKPKYILERLALSIFKFHTKDISNLDMNISGAEWWTQVIDSRDDIGVHWDRDYGLEDEGQHVYPYYATVSYLKATGGATIVWDVKGTKTPDDFLELNTGEGYIVTYPSLGKHLRFNGRLLHAAPTNMEALDSDNKEKRDQDSDEEESDVDDDSDGNDTAMERITFLVNIWVNHVPLQSKRFKTSSSSSSSSSSSLSSSGFDCKLDNPGNFLDITVENSSLMKWYDMEFSSGEHDYIMKLPVPSCLIKKNGNNSGNDSLRILYSKQLSASIIKKEDDTKELTSNEDENYIVHVDNIDNIDNVDGHTAKRPRRSRLIGTTATFTLLSLLYLLLLICCIIQSADSFQKMQRKSNGVQLRNMRIGSLFAVTSDDDSFLPPNMEDRDRKYVPPNVKDRIDKGMITAADLRRVFPPTKREIENLTRGKVQGQLAIIIRLEGLLVDLSEVYFIVFARLATELGEDTADTKKLQNCIGLSLKDSFINLGWNVMGDKSLSNAGKRFEELFKVVLEETFIEPNEGAQTSLDEYISEGNSLVISSSLPRDIALKVISKSGFAKLLEGRIDTAALICHDDQIDRNLGQQTIRSIAQLSRPLEFAVVIDSNARNVLAAKRIGAVVAATRSLTANIFALRSADSVVTCMSDLSVKSLYSIVTKAYENSQGPSPEPASASDSDLIKLKTLQAPAVADDWPKDTFADEFGADMF